MTQQHIDLVVLGSTGSFPGPDKPCSGYLFKGPDGNLLVDLGPGTMGNLQKFHDMDDIDAVLITHLHPDHYSDLFVFAIYLEFFSKRTRPLRLLGPKGSRERLSSMKWQSDAGLPDIFTYEELPTNGSFELAGFNVSTCINCHSEPANALRISTLSNPPVSITYTSDTALCDEVTQLSMNSDLLLAESTWLEAPIPDQVGHMTPKDAAILARTSGSKELVLTHIWPHVDPEICRQEAELELGDSVRVAAPGMSFRVSAQEADVTNIALEM